MAGRREHPKPGDPMGTARIVRAKRHAASRSPDPAGRCRRLQVLQVAPRCPGALKALLAPDLVRPVVATTRRGQVQGVDRLVAVLAPVALRVVRM